ncbi:MAG: hypothetical protein WBC93_20705, partial [Sulfitobacter sp.]
VVSSLGQFLLKVAIFGIDFDDLRHITQAFGGIVTGIWISRDADAVAGHPAGTRGRAMTESGVWGV